MKRSRRRGLRPLLILTAAEVLACSPRHDPAGARTGHDAASSAGHTAVQDAGRSPTIEPTAPQGEALRPEERDENPESATVKLKLAVTPPSARATVYWGRKKLGLAGPDPLEFERPRGSGPMDLLIVAPHAVPAHTRLFTDRNDKVTVRIYQPSEVVHLLGGKHSRDIKD